MKKYQKPAYIVVSEVSGFAQLICSTGKGGLICLSGRG